MNERLHKLNQMIARSIIVLALVAVSAMADTEETKLGSTVAVTGDGFGMSLAIGKRFAVVGAHLTNGVGPKSGSAYLFDITTGDFTFELTASDASPIDAFGRDVGISMDTVIVGANFDDDAGEASGSAYLFDVTTGYELNKLTALDASAGDQFGSSVGINGSTAIVGAPHDDHAGRLSGSAYLFDVITGTELSKLTASDAAAEAFFGHSVAISGGRAIVGAHGDDQAGASSGAAYIFDARTGVELVKLTPMDAAEAKIFGRSVAISGNTAIVGAQFDDHAGNASGAAYLFDVTTGEQLAKLTAFDAAFGDNFGVSVAINGNHAVVGALLDDDSGKDSGSVYVYDTTTGDHLAKLIASDAARGDRLGFSVAINNGVVAIGTNIGGDMDGVAASAYLFSVPSVPEPGSLLLLALGSWLLSLCRTCPN